MTIAAVIVAAGSGLRAGGDVPKQYQMLAAKPVIVRTLEVFLHHPAIDHVQVVIGADHKPLYDAATDALNLSPPVIGADTRQGSVANGLEALATHAPDKVLIHDAARCFVSPALISSIIEALDGRSPGAVPGLAVTDTLKRADDLGVIDGTVPRQGLYAVQTPQGFLFDKIRAAHAQAQRDAQTGLTDDAAIAEYAGLKVKVIPGEAGNIKLTTAGDIEKAEVDMQQQHQITALSDIRIGHGYDVHAFEPGDHVILCGIKIPHDAKLKGHSDADVAMHTLTDAILGAIAEGDIGKHFPPSEAAWKAADSAIFLKHAVDLVAAKGGVISHCDVTVICETPKLRPHVEPMRQRLAGIMELDIGRISVKATTSERLGFTGRQEGIAATATATIRLPS